MQPLHICVVLISTILWTVSGLKIGAFNIQMFGSKKSANKETMEIIGKIVKKYDILLIQEIRDAKEETIPNLLKRVNTDPRVVYNAVISARLGTTPSKEQYAFVYREDTVTIINTYQYPDDRPAYTHFERPPFSILVSSKKESIGTFFLLGIHTKPENAFNEINSLYDAFKDVSIHYGTKKGMILGDFNAGCDYLSAQKYDELKLVKDSSFTWLLDQNTYTSVKRNCPYDKIVVHATLLPSVSAKTASVYRFDKVYRLKPTATVDVSDHFPVEVDMHGTKLRHYNQ